MRQDAPCWGPRCSSSLFNRARIDSDRARPRELNCYYEVDATGPPNMSMRRRALVSELLSADRLELFAACLAERAKNVEGIAGDHLS
jgi:hypothetical protein